MARAVGRVEDLVVEDGEVEGQTQTDGVGGREIVGGDGGGGRVGLQGLGGRFLADVAVLELYEGKGSKRARVEGRDDTMGK